VTRRAAAVAKRRAAQRRVLYTHPVQPRAGQRCDVFYNPDRTVLRGRPDVFVRGSWNRWAHPDGIPTTKMEPAFSGGIGWLKVHGHTVAIVCLSL
jgi:starch synthase